MAQVNAGATVNSTLYKVTDWHLCFFVCAQNRQENTELIDPETDGEHDEEIVIIKKRKSTDTNQFNQLQQWVMFVFSILKKQKWKPLKMIPAVKILRQSKQHERRRAKSLYCVLSCENTAHGVMCVLLSKYFKSNSMPVSVGDIQTAFSNKILSPTYFNILEIYCPFFHI